VNSTISRQSGWNNVSRLIAVLLLTLSPGLAAAAESREIEPLASLKEAARAFLEQEAAQMQGEVEVRIGRLDPRLRLARCDQPLSGFWPNGGRKLGNVTVGVRCEGSASWSIYVRAKLSVFESVVVASRPLSRGSKVGPGDLELLREDVTRLTSGYYSAIEEVRGMEVRRSIRAGMVLNRSLVKAPILIKRGEKVTITAASGSVQVRMEGKALDAGARGELIEVLNLSSKQKVEAEVIAPGVVRVRM